METLSALTAALAPTTAALNAYGRDVVLPFFNPAIDVASHPLKGYPLIELAPALYVALAYVALVALGFALKPAVVAKEAKGPSVPVAQKFAAEPVLYLQTLYNAVQVALCGFMMVEASRLWWVNPANKGVFCTPFNGKSATFASVLWLFYVSKVGSRAAQRDRTNSIQRAAARSRNAAHSPTPPAGARLFRHLFHHRAWQVVAIYLPALLPPLFHLPHVLARLERGQ